MSVLTKIFVSLLVVLSLLLSAATITFVNSITATKAALTAQEDEANKAKAAAAQAQSDAAAAAAAASTAQSQLQAQIAELQKAADQAKKEVGDIGGQLASANTAATIAQANVSKTTSAVSALQASNTAYQEQLAAYRAENDKLQTQNGDLNIALAEATNKLNVTEEARRLAAEQLAEARTQLDKVSGALRDRGIDPTRIASSGLAAGAPPINGVIRNTREIAGVPHAQISIGSDDAVKVGMEFNVLDHSNGKFLGKMTIVAVEPNEAVGRLTGPDIAAITAGAEVRTQL